jgi:hypothetical protein
MEEGEKVIRLEIKGWAPTWAGALCRLSGLMQCLLGFETENRA